MVIRITTAWFQCWYLFSCFIKVFVSNGFRQLLNNFAIGLISICIAIFTCNWIAIGRRKIQMFFMCARDENKFF